MATENVAEDVQKLKEEIKNYKAGNINGLSYFPDARAEEMCDLQIHIAVFGMTGSGKSALINTVEKILLGSEQGGNAMEQSAGGEGTILLEEYLCQMGFTLLDTRGFFEFDFKEETELFRILYGTVRASQELQRDEKGERRAKMAGRAGYKLQKAAITDQVHVVLWVVKGNDIRLKQGEYINKFRFLREQLGKETITIITVITHDDELEKKEDPAAERAAATKLIREATGSVRVNTFLISNWLCDGGCYEVEMQKKVLDMLRAALDCGERSVKMRQSKREFEKLKKAKDERAKKPGKSPVQNTEEPQYFLKSL